MNIGASIVKPEGLSDKTRDGTGTFILPTASYSMSDPGPLPFPLKQGFAGRRAFSFDSSPVDRQMLTYLKNDFGIFQSVYRRSDTVSSKLLARILLEKSQEL